MKNLLSRAKGFLGGGLLFVSLMAFIFGSLGYLVGIRSNRGRADDQSVGCEQRSVGIREKPVLGAITRAINKNEPQENEAGRKRIYLERSPNGEQDIILYEMPFVGEGELDYRNYLHNQYFYAVRDISFTSGRETYVFVNDYKTGYPHWLDNEYIFFTSGCGTGCQGMYLVNVNTRETRQALLESISLGAESYETHFRDWFGQSFKFPGWSKNVRSASVEGKTYLIFQMWNNSRPLGEKRLLFTGKSLELI